MSQLDLFDSVPSGIAPGTVMSVYSGDNGGLIAQAAMLWIKPSDVVVDVTYGNGLFWSVFKPKNLIAHDIAQDGVDLRALPEGDGSVDVLVLDPPYISGGRAKSTKSDFNSRYGLSGVEAPRNYAEVLALYQGGIREARRVLKVGGVLMVKVSDFVEGRQFRTSHYDVVSFALSERFSQTDEFVHVRGTGPLASSVKRQDTSRRVHSFLCIFRKRK